MKVLVIEDEKELSGSICDYLANEQFVCERALNFQTALEKISLYDYACIILDVNLPGGSGLDDKVFALKAGADDYLTKPFHLAELGARVAAIIRRKSFEGKNQVILNELTLDLSEKTVLVNHKPVDLTRKEYELLLYFISNKNKVIAKNAIAEHLWGDNMDLADNYDFIYTHIKNLRKKLLQCGSADYIKSVYGMGYKFSA